MKTVDFELNGKVFPLFWNAAALFAAWDRFGDKGDMMDHFTGNTEESWNSTVWMIVKLAQQGEAWRRYSGEDPQPMLTVEEVQRTACPMDVIRMRAAIREAYFKAFERETASEEEEIDLGLLELQKKTAPASPDAGGSASRPSFLASLFGRR